MNEVTAKARAAFAELQNLDPHHAQRQELRASGVSEHRILALYGRPWVAMTPALIRHLQGVKDEELLLEGCITLTQADTLWYSVSPTVYKLSDLDDDLDDDELRELRLDVALIDYIAQRFEEAAPGVWVAGQDLTPFAISTGIWSAHWLMANRALLTTKKRKLADELMIAIARTIALPAK